MNSPEQHLPRITASNSENGVVNAQEDGKYYVMLPCAVKDFHSFVAGLLGKPQELRGELRGTFKIRHADISNIYHLLEQRMAKQNDATLVHFAINVFYDDGQSVVHNNVAAFESYHPTNPCHPVAVKISATYLIKFRGHETPEKQEIEVSFATHSDYRDGTIRYFHNDSFFEYRIIHTERTWATDIAGLLKSHASTVLATSTGFPKFLRRYSDEIAIYFSQLVFLVSVFVWSEFAVRLVAATTADIESLKHAATFLVKSVPALAILVIMVVAIKTYVDSTRFFYRQAYILFTEHDMEKFREDEKHKLWSTVRYALVWIVSIATGVVSNILYSKNYFW